MERTRSTVQRCHSTRNMSKTPLTFSTVTQDNKKKFNFSFHVNSSTQLNEKQKETLDWTDDSPVNCSLHVNKAICLLSHHPFGDTFEKWLRFIYVSTIFLSMFNNNTSTQNVNNMCCFFPCLFCLENVKK